MKKTTLYLFSQSLIKVNEIASSFIHISTTCMISALEYIQSSLCPLTCNWSLVLFPCSGYCTKCCQSTSVCLLVKHILSLYNVLWMLCFNGFWLWFGYMTMPLLSTTWSLLIVIFCPSLLASSLNFSHSLFNFVNLETKMI